MHDNERLIHRFYSAFSLKDAETMGACYHPDATFSDPVFPSLDARGVRGMWAMLCAQGGDDLKVEFSNVSADGTTGSAHWEAWYGFGPRKRPVHNRIDATFAFRDGLIIEHVDVFDFYAWSKMALGLPGTLLGWTAFLQGKVQAQAGAQLKRRLAKQG